MTTEACGFWSPGDCDGTPHCPPRCPRFVDRRGEAYLLLPLEDGCPAGDVESTAEAARATADAAIEALVAMYLDFDPSHRSMGLPPVTESEIRRWLEGLRKRGTNVLAWDDGTVVGHAGFSPTGDEYPEFFVYVHQEYHGRGLGTELTKHAVAAAAADDCRGLVLDVAVENESAVSIYRRLGFETVERRGVAWRMRLSFDDPIAERVRLAPAARS